MSEGALENASVAVQKSRLIESGIPKLYWEAKRPQLSCPHCRKLIKTYFANVQKEFADGHGICFFGREQTKSAALSICAKIAIVRGFGVRQITESDFVDIYTATWNSGDKTPWNTLLKTDFLMIDEMNPRDRNDVKRNALTMAVEKRFREKLPVFLAGDLIADDEDDSDHRTFSFYYGAGLWKKILEACSVIQIGDSS